MRFFWGWVFVQGVPSSGRDLLNLLRWRKDILIASNSFWQLEQLMACQHGNWPLGVGSNSSVLRPDPPMTQLIITDLTLTDTNLLVFPTLPPPQG